MQYEIQGAPYPVAIINMNSGESVLCQSGAMVWMSPNMKMETKAGGFGKAAASARHLVVWYPASPYSRTPTLLRAAPA